MSLQGVAPVVVLVGVLPVVVLVGVVWHGTEGVPARSLASSTHTSTALTFSQPSAPPTPLCA